MKKIFLLIILFTLFQSQITPAQNLIKIGGSPYPISTFEENGNIIGLDFEIVEEILREAGIHSTQRVLKPWKRIVYELDSGAIDMVVPMVFTKERNHKYHLTPSIRVRHNIIIVRKNFQNPIHELIDLKGLRVGKCDGYAYQKDFLEAAENKLFEPCYCLDNQMGLHKLKSGRSEAFMIGEDAARYLIQKLGYEGEIKYSGYRAEKGSHVAFHKSNTELYQKFLTGFEKAQRKGTILNIIKKWEKKYSIEGLDDIPLPASQPVEE